MVEKDFEPFFVLNGFIWRNPREVMTVLNGITQLNHNWLYFQ